ncbi:MAG TPA: 3-oxoacyl-ACP reductase family protein [Chloroflexota bacterium]|nr:3-oxoacyl-ACP reductase family protein [Chloroflexota bacterium]
MTGASRGIGRVTALSLAQSGFSVAINYRAAEAEAEAVIREITKQGGNAAPFQADLSVEGEARGLVDRVEGALGPLCVLVNNAGAIRDRLIVKMSEEDWNFTWDTNLAGPRLVSRAALRSMAERRDGRIINVSSVVGATGNAGQANYATAKSALLGLTRDLALEGAPFGIPVNCIIPGYILTDATSHLDKGQQEAWFRRIPMARPATAPDVAELVTYLATSRSTYLTGQCIAVDGGLLAFES